MNKRQFAERVKKHLNASLPNMTFNADSEDFSLNVIHNGKSEKLFLTNIYKEFEKGNFDGSMDALVSFFSTLDDEKMSVLQFNRELITIAVRSFSGESLTRFVSRGLTNELSAVFAIEHEDHLHFVDREVLSRFFDEDELNKQAVANIVKNGWLNHASEEHSAAGRMLLFRNTDEEFLFQFFFQDMAEHYLGNEYYLILPCNSIAMALIPNTVNKDALMEGVLKLKEFAVKLHSRESNPISEKVYRFVDGVVQKLG